MKKLYYLLLLVFPLVFASCSENDEAIDPRDPFIGTWSETYETTVFINGDKYEDSGFGTMTISKGNASDEIIMITDGEAVTGKVNGTTLVIPVQGYTDEINGETLNFDYAGNGKLTDGQLVYNITMKEVSGYNITATGKITASKSK